MERNWGFIRTKHCAWGDSASCQNQAIRPMQMIVVGSGWRCAILGGEMRRFERVAVGRSIVKKKKPPCRLPANRVKFKAGRDCRAGFRGWFVRLKRVPQGEIESRALSGRGKREKRQGWVLQTLQPQAITVRFLQSTYSERPASRLVTSPPYPGGVMCYIPLASAGVVSRGTAGAVLDSARYRMTVTRALLYYTFCGIAETVIRRRYFALSAKKLHSPK